MGDQEILARVRRAIALNRTPGFNFPGHFLELSYERVSRGRAAAALETGEHNADADGQMSLGPFALLADMALASSMRAEVGARARTATVAMSLQFTGAPRTGRITARAGFDGFVDGVPERHGLTRVELRSGRSLVATGSGTFIVLGPPDATPMHPLPRRPNIHRAPLLDLDHLNHAEEEVYRHAVDALRARGPFIDNFWGYRPRRTKRGATCTAWNGLHIGNRVGHVQGGVSFGLATRTAAAALPEAWRMVGASAWYVGPGTGKRLHVKSRIVHRGLLTAVVHTRIANDEGRGVLECMTSHARGAPG